LNFLIVGTKSDGTINPRQQLEARKTRYHTKTKRRDHAL